MAPISPPSITAAVIDRFIDPVNRVPNTGPIAGSPFVLPAPAFNLVVHANNRFLYVPHGQRTTSLRSRSTKRQASCRPCPAVRSPLDRSRQSMFLSPNGQFAYVLNRGSPSIYVYSVNTHDGGADGDPGASCSSLASGPTGCRCIPGSSCPVRRESGVGERLGLFDG